MICLLLRGEDHIKWALEHDQYDQALEIAEHAMPPLSKERLTNLAERYLAHLVHDGEFIQAAGKGRKKKAKSKQQA